MCFESGVALQQHSQQDFTVKRQHGSWTDSGDNCRGSETVVRLNAGDQRQTIGCYIKLHTVCGLLTWNVLNPVDDCRRLIQRNAVIQRFSRRYYATPVGVLTIQQLALPLEVADLKQKEIVPDLKHAHF